MTIIDRLSNGPITVESRRIRPKHRRELDVRRMRYTGSPSSEPTGTHNTVYFSPEHDPERVVRKYVETNPDLLNRRKGVITRFFNRYGPEYGDAWRDISGEYDVKTAGREASGGLSKMETCPLCTEPIDRLATHLPDCNNG